MGVTVYRIIVIMLLLAILAAQVYMIVELSRPVIRPGTLPKKAPTKKLPDAWYEKYKDQEGCNFSTEQMS